MKNSSTLPSFSRSSFLLASVVNAMGCVLLGGMRFLEGMAEFGPTIPLKPTLGTILCWLWSPIAMSMTCVVQFDVSENAWLIFYGFLSIVPFGIFFGFFTPWHKKSSQR